jgi:hypothetical protein
MVGAVTAPVSSNSAADTVPANNCGKSLQNDISIEIRAVHGGYA